MTYYYFHSINHFILFKALEWVPEGRRKTDVMIVMPAIGSL